MRTIHLAIRRGPCCVWAFRAETSEATTITVAEPADDPDQAGPVALERIHRVMLGVSEPMTLVIHDRLLHAACAGLLGSCRSPSSDADLDPAWRAVAGMIRENHDLAGSRVVLGDDDGAVERLLSPMDAAAGSGRPWESVTTRGSAWEDLQPPAHAGR